MGAMSCSTWPRSPSHGICSPTFCGSSRNFDRRQSHQPRKAFVRYASEPRSRERCASMTENSAIFNARHGAGSFHPHRQPAPTAQDCLKRGTGANSRTARQLSGECRFNSMTWPFSTNARSSLLKYCLLGTARLVSDGIRWHKCFAPFGQVIGTLFLLAERRIGRFFDA